MDALKIETIHALEQVIGDAEDCLCRITQDLTSETLKIENNIGQTTVMNCRMNSVGATIKQVCYHINKCDLFSYEPNYTIGG